MVSPSVIASHMIARVVQLRSMNVTSMTNLSFEMMRL